MCDFRNFRQKRTRDKMKSSDFSYWKPWKEILICENMVYSKYSLWRSYSNKRMTYFKYKDLTVYQWKNWNVWLRGFFGRPQKLWSFRYPEPLMLYCIFKKEFLKVFEMCSFRYMKFLEKYLKIFKQNFWNFVEIEKIIILVVKLVKNHHIDQNLAKFSLKTPKMPTLS